jgi:hypothetical protein
MQSPKHIAIFLAISFLINIGLKHCNPEPPKTNKQVAVV